MGHCLGLAWLLETKMAGDRLGYDAADVAR